MNNIKFRKIFFLFSLGCAFCLYGKGQLYYINKEYKFDGVEFKTSVQIVEEKDNETYFEISIIDNNGNIKYSEKIQQGDYERKYWLKEPLSFYNSIGLVAFKAGGDYFYDFITKKKILSSSNHMRNSFPFGEYISVITNDQNFEKKINTAFINVYNRNLDLVRKVKLPIIEKKLEEYYRADFIEKSGGTILEPDISKSEIYFRDPNYKFFGYNSKDNYFFNPFTNQIINFGASILQNLNCPSNFDLISEENITGTAKKYKAQDGHFYYEVKITINPNPLTKKYTKQLKGYRYRKYPDGLYKDLGLERDYKLLNASNGVLTFMGCVENDIFRIEGIYTCETGRFKGPSADIYFRDLRIIQ